MGTADRGSLTLQGSPYDGTQTHAASEWELASASGSSGFRQVLASLLGRRPQAPKGSPLLALQTGPVTSLALPPRLYPSGSYTFRVRYQDDQGDWSPWSDPQPFSLNDPGDSNGNGVADAQEPGRVTLAGRAFDNSEAAAKACTTQCWNGAIGFVTSAGSLSSLEGMHLRDVLPETYQSAEGSIAKFGGILQVGIYALQISGLPTGGAATVTLYLPGTLPAGRGRVFVYDYRSQQASSSEATGETGTATVSDGGAGDSDGQADGQILLLVGPGTTAASTNVRNIGDGRTQAPASFQDLMGHSDANVCYGIPAAPGGGGGGGGCNGGFSGLAVLGILLPLCGFLVRRR